MPSRELRYQSSDEIQGDAKDRIDAKVNRNHCLWPPWFAAAAAAPRHVSGQEATPAAKLSDLATLLADPKADELCTLLSDPTIEKWTTRGRLNRDM